MTIENGKLGGEIKAGSTEAVAFPVPLHLRRGALRLDEWESVKSGIELLKLVGTHTVLTGATILDNGCGVKLVQALIQEKTPIKKYVGIDVDKKMIEFLRASCTDPRFEFHDVDFSNQLYNKKGRETLSRSSQFPIPNDTRFDIMTMFSVITHMSPPDTEATLAIMRRYARDNTVLIFSCFLGFNQEHDFVDRELEKPLLYASYRPKFLREIVARAGWRTIQVCAPTRIIQHHFICQT